MVAASADGRTIAAVQGLRVLVRDKSRTVLLTFAVDASVETALVAGELYRRADAWKFRVVAQRYTDGVGRSRARDRYAVDDPEPAAGSALRVDWLNPPVPAGYEN